MRATGADQNRISPMLSGGMKCVSLAHLTLLIILGFLLPLREAADLVIRIPGNGQPKDGYYRLDYR